MWLFCAQKYYYHFIRKQEDDNGTDIYEREKDTAACAVYGAADGVVHGGELFVQYCGQLLCGTVQ